MLRVSFLYLLGKWEITSLSLALRSLIVPPFHLEVMEVINLEVLGIMPLNDL